MDARKQLVELAQGAVPGINVSEELDGIDGPYRCAGVRRFHRRMVVVFAHDGQVHGLRTGDAHPCVHVVEQVHVKEQVPGNGGNEPKRSLLERGFIHARFGQHIAHAVVDGLHRGGKGEGRHGARQHLAYIPFGEKMSAQVVLAVKFFNVNYFGGDWTHLKEIQRFAPDGPFDVFVFAEGFTNPLPGLVELPDLGLGEQVVAGGPVAFAGNFVPMRAHLAGNQVLALALHSLDEDGVSGAGGCRKEHAGLFAVYHGLHDHVHAAFPQPEVPGVILHPPGLQGRHAFANALNQAGAVHEQEGIILAGVGSACAVFVGGGGPYGNLGDIQSVKRLIYSIFVKGVEVGNDKSFGSSGSFPNSKRVIYLLISVKFRWLKYLPLSRLKPISRMPRHVIPSRVNSARFSCRMYCPS